jgi:hypothetical protein
MRNLSTTTTRTFWSHDQPEYLNYNQPLWRDFLSEIEHRELSKEADKEQKTDIIVPAAVFDICIESTGPANPDALPEPRT